MRANNMKQRFFLLTFLLCSLGFAGRNVENKASLSKYSHIVIFTFGKVGHGSLFQLFRGICPTTQTHNPHPVQMLLEKKEKFLVVNSLRNIFDRNKSAFFQNIKDGYVQIKMPFTLEDLLEAYPGYNMHQIHTLQHWYNDFNNLLNIHPSKTTFDFENKYYFEEKENYDVLVLRYEDISEWPTILKKALNINVKTIPITHVRKNPFYASFKSAYHYTEQEAELMLKMDFMQHYYTQKERRQFIAKHQ